MDVFSQLPTWMLFLLGVIWLLTKMVVGVVEKRRERKVERIKREYKKRSLPPPPMNMKASDDTGVFLLRELEAEAQERSRLRELHADLTDAQEWRGKMLAVESQQNSVILEVRRDIARAAANDQKFHAALLDSSAQTNELLRQALGEEAGGGGNKTLAQLRAIRGDRDA